jgi:hypothetical protein
MVLQKQFGKGADPAANLGDALAEKRLALVVNPPVVFDQNPKGGKLGGQGLFGVAEGRRSDCYGEVRTFALANEEAPIGIMRHFKIVHNITRPCRHVIFLPCA